ncbi:MAG: hypothetical protein LBB79_02720, partial [Prevotellaceae bacterium]|nr:hypothetical protein [Prevotellaceae bacterium]
MDTKNSSQLSIHLLVWGGIMLIPFAVFYLRGVPYEHIARSLPVLLGYLVIFYFNYALLINRYLFNKKIAKFVIANLLVIAAVRLVMNLFHDMLFPIPHAAERISMLLETDTIIPPHVAERIAMLLGNDAATPPHAAERIAMLLGNDAAPPP